MNEHNIDNFMKLATNHKNTADRESDPDHYYRVKYDEIASGKKFTFNWCSFLFNSTWLLYRKMYLYGILLSVFQCLYGACVMSIYTHMVGMSASIALKILFGIIIVSFALAPGIFFGFVANWLYVRYIHARIDQGYHLSNVRNTDKLTWSVVFVLEIVLDIVLRLSSAGSLTPGAGYMQYLPTVLHILLASVLGFVAVKRDEKNLRMALTEKESTSAVGG